MLKGFQNVAVAFESYSSSRKVCLSLYREFKKFEVFFFCV